MRIAMISELLAWGPVALVIPSAETLVFHVPKGKSLELSLEIFVEIGKWPYSSLYSMMAFSNSCICPLASADRGRFSTGCDINHAVGKIPANTTTARIAASQHEIREFCFAMRNQPAQTRPDAQRRKKARPPTACQVEKTANPTRPTGRAATIQASPRVNLRVRIKYASLPNAKSIPAVRQGCPLCGSLTPVYHNGAHQEICEFDTPGPSTISASPHASATTTGRSHPSVAETRSCTRQGRLLRPNQFRQTLKPKLDVAKQLGREVFRPQLAFAQEFPFLRGRVRHTVSPHDSPQFHRLACAQFPIFPLPKGQVFPANHAPIPARLLLHHRHFLLLRHVTLARVGKCALDRPETLHASPGQVVREIAASDH